MARSSTTVKPGQQLALKHGAYSAARRLEAQNQTLEVARERLQAKKLTPLELQVYRTLRGTLTRQKQVTARLNSKTKPIPLKDLMAWITLEATLHKSVHIQTMALWKMLAATPAQSLDLEQARTHLSRYAAPSATASPI